MGGMVALEAAGAADDLGAWLYWLLGLAAVWNVFNIVMRLRSSTVVDATGITIRRGIGRGRTYAWEDIRWVDVRDSEGEGVRVRDARITLSNGRRRRLPGLHDSTLFPARDFDDVYRQVVNWWEMSTDPAMRGQPSWVMPASLAPTALGVVLGLLVTVVILAACGVIR